MVIVELTAFSLIAAIEGLLFYPIYIRIRHLVPISNLLDPLGTRHKPFSIAGRITMTIIIAMIALFISGIPLTYLLTLLFPGQESTVTILRDNVWLGTLLLTLVSSGLYRAIRFWRKGFSK